MDRWRGRVAVVTGASSGIGAELAKQLVRQGLKVVGVARRVELVEALEKDLSGAHGKLYPYKADVSIEKDILKMFVWIKKNLGSTDILINNAALVTMVPLTDGPNQPIRDLFQINVVGLSVCAREAIKSMREKGVDDGHIINITGVGGHYYLNIPGSYPASASKRAVIALTEELRRELAQQKSRIKVTSVSPGLVNTELVQGMMSQFPSMSNAPILQTKDMADAIIYVLGTPPHVQIHELMIRPVGEM